MTRVQRVLRAVVLTSAALMLSRPAMAQVTTGNISGTVVDQQGGVLPGVVVMATHLPTGTPYKTVTDKDGRYQLLEVRVGGPYAMKVTLAGFKDAEAKDVVVKLGEDHTVDFKMELASVTATVEVSAPPIDATQPGAAGNITAAQKDSVPTIARSIFDIVQTNPYFTGYNAKGNGQLAIAVAGRNNRYNNIQIDGAVNNDIFGLSDSGTPEGQAGAQPISLDAVQEFQLVVSPYDVRQGGFSGGGLNIVTRSGSNTFGGDGFLYGRNQGVVGKYFNPTLAQTNPSTAVTTVGNVSLASPPFTDKQGGGSLGGPILKNRVFFFASSDSEREQTPTGITADGAAPNFATSLFPNTQAAVDTILSTLENKYNYNPAGTSGLDPDASFNRITNSDKVFARVDLNLGPKERLTIRNNYVNSLADSGFPSATAFLTPDDYARFHITTNSTVGQLNSTVGTASVNELRLAYTDITNQRGGEPFSPDPFPHVSVTIAPGDTVAVGRDANSTANQLLQNDLELNDDFTTVRGNNTISFGTHDEFFRFQDLFIANSFGTYSFTSLANFEAGLAQSFSYQFSNTGNPLQQADFRVSQYGAYVGDQWRAGAHFTVTGGLRVDLPRFNRVPNANPLTVTDFDLRTDITPSPTQWSPRVGFNWDPWGHGRQQLRGGVGVFSGRTPYVWISNQYTNDGIDFTSINIKSASANMIPFVADPNAQPVNPKGGVVTAQTINLVDPSFKFPSQLRANLAFDTSLPWGLVGKGEFLFNKTVEDVLYKNLNITETGTSTLDGRPLYGSLIPTLGPVIELTNTTEGHGWSVSYDVQRSFRHNFAFEASYFYGQQFTPQDSESSIALTSWSDVYSPTPNSPAETVSDFDPGHRVSANVSYQLPAVHGVAAILSLFYAGQSGHPYTLSYSFDANGDGQGFNDNLYLLPPSQAASVAYSTTNGTAVNYQTLADFLSSLGSCVTNQIGTIFVRNSCRSPWVNTLNARLAFRLPFKRTKTDLTVDVLNLLNLLNDRWGLVRYTSFDQIDSIDPFTTAGQITKLDLTAISPATPGAFSPILIDDARSRWEVQFGLRIVF